MLKKVIITTNPLNHEGGVANYYRIFFKKFKSDRFELVHQTFGSRMKYYYSPLKKITLYPFYYFIDFARFAWRLFKDDKIRIVQVSPSLIPVPLIRDAFVVLFAKCMDCHTIVFFRGWRENVAQYIKGHSFLRWLFCLVYQKANRTLVLASQFKDDLVDLGWNPSSVQITTTLYEAEKILPHISRLGQRPRFLFLGRVSELKGIGELIEATRILFQKGYDFEFLIVGNGDRVGVIDAYMERILDYSLNNHFTFTGYLKGKNKYQAYADSDVYVLPSWTEGCPNSVLEALGTGLFVISTDVGALKDIICEDVNGWLVRCKDANDLADKLAKTCENIEEIRARRKQIQDDALNHYEAGSVVNQIAKIYNDILLDHTIK